MRCDGSGCESNNEAPKFQTYFKALHCPMRWKIIRLMGRDEKTTGEIFQGLLDSGENLARSSLYYHLSELEKAGVIELAGYREQGGGAPEKVWRLKVKGLRIDLLEGFKIEYVIER